MLLSILFLATLGCAWAQTTLFPTIVQLIQQAAPTQAFPNTAGSTNEFLVTVETDGVLPNKVVVSNQVMTLFGFRGIPPGAKDCYLFANLPAKYPIWQFATSSQGPPTDANPTLIYRGLDTSIFDSTGSWTWNSIIDGGHILNIGPQGEYNGLFASNWRDPVVLQSGCPGVNGPWGGEVGYAVSMSTQYSTGWVFLNQHYVYGNESETAGVYMTYIY